MKNDPKFWNNLIPELRREQRISQRRLAAIAKVSRSTLRRIEAGRSRNLDMQQETVVRLISEPGTLLPHLMESSTRSSTTMAVDGENQASSRVEEKRFVYTY